MSELRVMEGLQQLGWTQESNDRLRLQVSGFDIHAIEGMLAMGIRPGVQFTGSFFRKRTGAEIDFALPVRVESLDQLKALLAYYLDMAFDSEPDGSDVPDWLSEGRGRPELLPWDQEPTPCPARDHCLVERDWMRFGLNKLKALLGEVGPRMAIGFGFDGSVLRIETPLGLIAMPARGEAWQETYQAAAGDLQPLPRRLMRAEVPVQVYEKRLKIGPRAYPMMDDSEILQETTGPCDCVSDDPNRAAEAIQKCPVTDSLIDESHYAARLRKCDSCGQQFLRIFYELIDWRDGNDSQAWVTMLVTDQQVEQLRAIASGRFEHDLMDMGLEGRQLVVCHPRSGGLSRHWTTGNLAWFPHE